MLRLDLANLEDADASMRSCKDYQLANLYPARVVALGCVSVVMVERGLRSAKGTARWIERISGGKVNIEDFEETVDILRRLSVT